MEPASARHREPSEKNDDGINHYTLGLVVPNSDAIPNGEWNGKFMDSSSQSSKWMDLKASEGSASTRTGNGLQEAKRNNSRKFGAA